MKKTLAFLLVLVMALSCVTSFAAMVSYGDILHQSDFSAYESDIVGTDLSGAALFNKVDNIYTKGYVKDGSGYYYLTGAENGQTAAEWLASCGAQTLSDSFTGEYITGFKAKFVHYPNSRNQGEVAQYITYDGSDLNTSFIGLSCFFDNSTSSGATGSGEAIMNFKYRYKNTVDTSYELGRWTYKSNEWYTFRTVYNFDLGVVSVYVYDSTETEVVRFAHKLLYTEKNPKNGTTIPYKDVSISKEYVMGTKRGGTFIGDFVYSKNNGDPVTVTFDVTGDFDEDMVSVTYNGAEVKNGVASSVIFGEDAAFTVSARDGYEITGITVDGVAIDSKSEFSFADVADAHVFAVTAKELPNKYNIYYDPVISKATNTNATSLLSGELDETAGYFEETGGNVVFQYFTSNGSVKNTWYRGDFGYTAFNNNESGEYFVEYKLKYGNMAGDGRYANSSVRLQLKYGNHDDYSFGYVIDDTDGNKTADIKFSYHANDSSDCVFTPNGGSTWSFDLATWYTIQQVYNFDDMTAKLYIYNADGTELLASYSHELERSWGSTTVDYENIIYNCVKISIANKTRVALDDFRILKATHKPVVVNYDSTKGTVTYNGNPVVSGEKIPVAYNSATPAVFAISANDGYEIADVTVGDVSNSIIDSYSFTNITEDQTMTVSFAEKTVVPSVLITEYRSETDKSYTVDGEAKVSPYSVIIFGTLTGTPYEYGFKFAGGNLPEEYMLASRTVSDEGQFAIRVVGNALEKGSYSAAPYIIESEGDEAQTVSETADIEIE